MCLYQRSVADTCVCLHEPHEARPDSRMQSREVLIALKECSGPAHLWHARHDDFAEHRSRFQAYAGQDGVEAGLVLAEEVAQKLGALLNHHGHAAPICVILAVPVFEVGKEGANAVGQDRR